MKPNQGKHAVNGCDKLLLLAHVAANDYCQQDDQRNQSSNDKREVSNPQRENKSQTKVKGHHKSIQVTSPGENILHLSKSKRFKPRRKQRVVRTATFAMKLMSVLENKAFRHFISWLDDGKSFIILNQDAFTRCVLPSEFKTAKYESFTRKLYRWGFRRVASSMKDRAFFHPLFLRNYPLVCRRMRSGNLVDEMGVLA